LCKWRRFLRVYEWQSLARHFDLSIDTMIGASSMRWRSALMLAAGVVLALSNLGWAQTTPVAPPAVSTNPEEWQTTDLSLLDFITDGYDLVSVISPSSHTRTYFLTKPGKIVKCREEATPTGPPPIPPPPPTPGQAGTFVPTPVAPGQPGTFMPMPPDNVITSVRTEFECAELSRRTSRK
jgi:hypothetical protein